MEVEKIFKLAIFSFLLLISIALLLMNKLSFSLELQGGIKTTLYLKEGNITEVFEIIQKRISFLGLPDKAFLNDSKIEILSLNNESLPKILEKGKFEAKILRKISLVNSTGTFSLSNSYDVKVEDKKLLIENESYEENEKFKIENIEFKILNITNESVYVEGFFFGNKDVKRILQPSYISYNPDFKSYEFRVPVEISREASLRFEILTANAGRRLVPGGFVLDADLLYYLDGKLISELPLPVQMAGSRIENIVILGYGPKIEASEKINSIKLALETGELPSLEYKTEKIEGKIENIKEKIFLGIAGISLISFLISFKKYGKKGIWLPAFLFSEGIIVLGIASISQLTLKPGWIFDLYSIFGLFSFLCLSLLNYFLISEKILKNKKFELIIKFKKIGEASNLIKIFAIIISFPILFLPFKGFGLAILAGMVLTFLTNSLYAEKIKG